MTQVIPFCSRLAAYSVFLLCLMVSYSDARTTLMMNHQFPAATDGSKLDQWFADEVYKATKGAVEIKIYWSNKLGKPHDNLLLLQNNVIDLAAMSAGYFPKQLPFFSAPNSIPMGLDDICQSSEMMKTFYNQLPVFKQEAKRNKIRPLFFHLLNPYLLVSRKPVTKLVDIKGMRIRTWGDDMPRLILAAKGNPVKLFLPDIYPALKNGVIDAAPFSVDLMVSYKIYQLAKHVTEVTLWEGPSWGVWISEKSWQKIPDIHKKSILTIAEKARIKDIPRTLKAEKNARDYLRKKGVRFHPFPKSDLNQWKKQQPDFFNDLILKMDQLGKADEAKEMVKIWQQIRSQTSCENQMRYDQ